MTWSDITRPQYGRKFGRYASDCTDAEWALIARFMPGRKSNGRPRTEVYHGSFRFLTTEYGLEICGHEYSGLIKSDFICQTARRVDQYQREI